MTRNKTWVLVPKNSSDNVINSLWLFIVKEKVDISIDRLKATLVVIGMQQVEGQDYYKMFASVMKSVTIILVLIVAISRN